MRLSLIINYKDISAEDMGHDVDSLILRAIQVLNASIEYM